MGVGPLSTEKRSARANESTLMETLLCATELVPHIHSLKARVTTSVSRLCYCCANSVYYYDPFYLHLHLYQFNYSLLRGVAEIITRGLRSKCCHWNSSVTNISILLLDIRCGVRFLITYCCT